MKPASASPPILAVIPTLPVIVAFALLGATEARAETCAANPCDPYVVTIGQVGPNVVAMGSGEFDLTGLTLFGQNGGSATAIEANAADILFNGNFTLFNDRWLGTFSGPTNFGPGNFTPASSTSGPLVRFLGPTTNELDVSHGYTSGDLLAPSQDVFNNATFASLGITPGEVFRWTWGTAPDQSFTIDTTPLPATLPLFATGLGALGLLGWRRKRKAQAAT